jgi:hypothetical protein
LRQNALERTLHPDVAAQRLMTTAPQTWPGAHFGPADTIEDVAALSAALEISKETT